MGERWALVALAITNVAVLLGWLVTGFQRVAEAVTTDRRKAYADLLVAAERVRRGAASDGGVALDEAAVRAELVSTGLMRDSRLVPLLTSSAATGDDWSGIRERFVCAARAESLQNVATRRWLRRRSLYSAS